VTDASAAPAPPARTWFDRHTPTFAARYRASRTYRVLTWALIVLLPVAVALHVHQAVQKHRHDPRRQPADAITVLVTATCPFSRELEASLQAAGLPYRRLDVDRDDGADWAFLAVNARGVPVTVVGGNVVYGLRTTQLRAVLQGAGRDVSRLHFAREIGATDRERPLATPVQR
jgi:glutaredoxin